MPRHGLQQKRAAAALSQARSANMRHPATHAARRPDVRNRHQTDVKQTDVRQHHRLMPPGRGII